MKKLLFLFLILNLSVNGQENFDLVTDLSTSTGLNLGALDLGVSFGSQFQTIQGGDLNTSLVYLLSTASPNFLDIFNGKSTPVVRTHFLGGSLKYLFRNKEDFFRPFFQVNMLVRIGSNYKNGVAPSEGYIPVTGKEGSDDFGDYTVFYKFTNPFVFGLMVGSDFRLNTRFHLNLGVGYGLRAEKTKKRKVYDDYGIFDENNPSTSKIEKGVSQSLDFKVGLSYIFSFKKSD